MELSASASINLDVADDNDEVDGSSPMCPTKLDFTTGAKRSKGVASEKLVISFSVVSRTHFIRH
jgi:hypothetical protein